MYFQRDWDLLEIQFLGINKARTIYVETLTRLTELSLSARLSRFVVNRMIVQSPMLEGKYSGLEYYGVLV